MENLTKKIIQSFVLVLSTFSVHSILGQTVTLYTPNGSTVEAFYRTEMPANDISYYTNLYRNSYPEAEVLDNASNTYNCHSYAWHLTEGGTTICWLNQSPDLHKYWDDNSYVETTEANAEKIFYYTGDHSAVISPTVSGKYESKWGRMPLMQHAPEYGPTIYNMSYRKYFKKVFSLSTISGPSVLCSTGASFSVDNLPYGATVNWVIGGNITRVSSQGSNPCTFRASSSTSSGIATITANITFSSGTTATLTKRVWVGMPGFTLVGADELDPMAPGIIFLYDLNGNPIISGSSNDPNITNVNWSYSGPLDYLNGDTRKAEYRTSRTGGQGFIYAHATNPCGSVENRMYYTVNNWLKFYPNPTSGMLNIELTEPEPSVSSSSFQRAQSSFGELQVFDNQMRSVKTVNLNPGNNTVDLSFLRSDIYIIRITHNGKVSQHKIIVTN